MGGQSTVNFGRIHKDFTRITSDSVDPGGRGLISQLGKDPQRLCKGYLRQCQSWWVNQQSTWEVSVKTLQGLALTVVVLGGGGLIDSQLGKELQRLCKDYLTQC